MTSILAPLSVIGLIFGGCCSNVFALEAIVRSEPSSGLLITFLQFTFTALCSSPSQLSLHPNLGLKTPKVPLAKWAYIAFLFFSINMLNNWAFAFNISVPVHIILRSFGSVTTMVAGAVRGKRYSGLQVLSVMILTGGVLVSAWADSERKGKSMSLDSSATTSSEFTAGLSILLIAQLLSAYMGAYVEDTYANYGASWTENLFYSHFLSLPFFLPLGPSMQAQWTRLASAPPLDLSSASGSKTAFASIFPDAILHHLSRTASTMPRGLFFLAINATTQLACISGVNLIAAKSSAVTVTIVLNVRKLVSFMLSTWLFGHELSGKMLLGSAMVFGSGALYGLETSWRLPRERKRKAVEGKER